MHLLDVYKRQVRFDALMYGIELAYLVGKTYKKARKDLVKKVSGVASVANIPEIRAQSELIEKILHTDYLDNAGINEFEHIRELSLIHILLGEIQRLGGVTGLLGLPAGGELCP